MPPLPITRREALRRLALGAAGVLAFPAIVRARDGGPAANDRLNLAFIGVGGKGEEPALGLSAHNYVAFCDVDPNRAAKAYLKFPSVPQFLDFRVMFDRLGSQIDAVVISTPDHAHFPTGMTAMQLGKHLYLEKPLAPTIWETRQLHAMAKKSRVVTQMGIQGHSFTGLRVLKEWIDAGAVGDITEVFLWTDRLNLQRWSGLQTDAPAEPIPDGFPWDVWLSGRRPRGYSSRYVPQAWRSWWDFGSGAIGDIAVHMMDVVEYTLGVGFPSRVTDESSHRGGPTVPRWSYTVYEYPARGPRPPVKLHWNNGYKGEVLNKPTTVPHVPAELIAKETNVIAFAGTRGTILVPDMRASSRPQIFPVELEKEFSKNLPLATLPRLKGGHFDDWIRAIREGGRAGADFDYSAPLTEAVLLGTLAQRTGRPIVWDRAAMSALDVPEANALLKPELAPQWHLNV
jgi:predicted dehydrogenase